VKRLVWQLREREFHCCGQKIQYFLNLEHGIHLSVPKIYEILAEKYVIRSRWRKNRERGPIPEASIPREVVQMDSMEFGDIYAFHCHRHLHQRSRYSLGSGADGKAWRQVPISEHEEEIWGTRASDPDLMAGSEFKADFLANVPLFCHRHRVARPYRKNEQSYIESFNRTLRKECLGWQKYPPVT